MATVTVIPWKEQQHSTRALEHSTSASIRNGKLQWQQHRILERCWQSIVWFDGKRLVQEKPLYVFYPFLNLPNTIKRTKFLINGSPGKQCSKQAIFDSTHLFIASKNAANRSRLAFFIQGTPKKKILEPNSFSLLDSKFIRNHDGSSAAVPHRFCVCVRSLLLAATFELKLQSIFIFITCECQL